MKGYTRERIELYSDNIYKTPETRKELANRRKSLRRNVSHIRSGSTQPIETQ